MPFKRLNMATEVDFAHDPIFLAGKAIRMKLISEIKICFSPI